MEEPQRKKAKLISRLRALNEQFAEWIQDQLIIHREDVWLDGVEDYIGHAKNLLMEAADSDSPVSGLKEKKSQVWMNGQADEKAPMNGNEVKQSKPAATGQFAFASFSAPSETSGSSAALLSFAPPINSFSLPPASTSAAFSAPSPSALGGPQTTASLAPSSAGGLFSMPVSTAVSTSAASSAAPFSFGANPFMPASSGPAAPQPSLPAISGTPASAPAFGQGPGPIFGAPPGSTTNGSSQPLAFSWAANTGSTAGGGKPAEAADEAGDEAGEDEGPKAELKLSEDSTLLFKEPAKLYYKGKDGVGWDDRGKGTLTVRQSKAEEGQAAGSANVVFTMESGKVVVNGAVYKGLRAQKLKNPKMVCMNLTLALDEEKPDPKPQTVMFNIMNVDKAERFCSTVQDATPN